MVFTGCEKNEPCTCKQVTYELRVDQDEWEFDDNTHQFFAHFTIKELTGDVLKYGVVSATRVIKENNNTYQVALPMSSYLGEEIEYTDGTKDTIFYTQHIDYRYGEKYVDVQLINSDWSYYIDNNENYINPDAMTFIMRITY